MKKALFIFEDTIVTIHQYFRADIEPDNPQGEQYIAGLMAALIQELELKAESLDSQDLFITKMKLMDAAKMFRVSEKHSLAHSFVLNLMIQLNQNYDRDN